MLTGILIVFILFWVIPMLWLFIPGRIKIVQLDDGMWYVRRRWNGVYYKCLSRTDDYWWLHRSYHSDYCAYRTKKQAERRLKGYRSCGQ